MSVSPRYNSCYDSGIPGIDLIPSHWKTAPLIAVSKKKSICNCPEKELLSVYLDRGVVRFSDVDEKRTNATSEDRSKYQEVLPGDFVLNNQQAWRGSVGVSEYEGIVSPAYIVLELTKDFDSRFANYFFRNGAMVSQYLICSKGVGTIQRNLYWPQLKRAHVVIPPLDEQNRIANFLDRKTAEIDAAIAKKERLIELLDEQKSILINSLVTRGVNPHAATKDSELTWVSDTPAHWQIRYLKHLFRETDCRTTTGEEPLFSLRMSGQLLRHNDVSDKPITADQLIGYKIVCPGQLVMNRMRASMGLFAVAHEHGLVSPDYAVFDCLGDFSPEYFLALFRNSAIRGVFLTESKGLGTGSSGFLRLYSDRFGGIKVPCPPRREQEAIVQAINDHVMKFADVERSVKSEIEKLIVMRSIFIADAVTGKIRV